MGTREEKYRCELLEELEKTNRIVDWDDGFTPSGCDGRKGTMVMEQPRSTPGLVAVVDNVVPDELAKAVYRSAVEAKVWGEYINLEDIDNLVGLKEICPTNRRYLAAAVVHAFFRERCAHLVAGDWKNNVHGVSVWVIASDVGNSVQYHVDYAEMFRFQTNVIYPPMYGGTLHLTPTKDLKGGEFYANLGGLDHYKDSQYKCPLDKFDLDGGDWIKVPYRYNRATLCDGNLPHFSAPVQSIPDGMKRVIVGFNICNHEIGPIVEEYPEHSAKFNKYVKLSQTAGKFQGGLTVEAVKNNPRLAAFVKLLARKMKEKHQSDEDGTMQDRDA
uniref:Uncharacterized protein n=1 Tax=Pseudo-nitzschia australis TaxID=44445 RepID=A0A6U9Z8K8_9STRA|mmetsp:Transcript_5493/g.12022  ORF Transcript_5493/g.12022 Transcript_5493/m.12022 type:complete len:329 (+) Transcript_5493:102-1088(+)|eukprot:CAMPEP_0168167686 /NCGR_PEP_ID=MMETSP0139_2-20121125/2673_1 /TAXON_ID=44445 /ORGANISM="Pseudo-nitzschia australis, Strain 10249 10 AB" /LENGTH=328 /DNA_ID=CAMNT_0008084927 /DNA_START=56 /DNA_END=1042 /DNA_ORIENTATION=+